MFSSRGSLKISRKMGWYFLNITVETWKFLSSNSIFFRKSPDAFDISSHFFILLKNCIRLRNKDKYKFSEKSLLKCLMKMKEDSSKKAKDYLNFAALSKRVRETQFPSTVPELSTVGTTLRRQATYKAHASQ